jgi:hypothetical protein
MGRSFMRFSYKKQVVQVVNENRIAMSVRRVS